MTTTTTNTNTTSEYIPKEFAKWEDLEDFSPELLRGIYAYGFDRPSAV